MCVWFLCCPFLPSAHTQELKVLSHLLRSRLIFRFAHSFPNLTQILSLVASSFLIPFYLCYPHQVCFFPFFIFVNQCPSCLFAHAHGNSLFFSEEVSASCTWVYSVSQTYGRFRILVKEALVWTHTHLSVSPTLATFPSVSLSCMSRPRQQPVCIESLFL